MNRRFDRLKGILGIFLAILAVAGIYIWERWGRENLTTEEILVFCEDIPAHTVILPNHLKMIRRQTQNLMNNPIHNKKEVVGRMSKHFIPANTALSPLYFENSDLIPKDGEYIFQMPRDWIQSCPSTLRRSDDAYLYPVWTKKEEAPHEKNEAPNIGRTVRRKNGSLKKDAKPIHCLKIAFVKNQSNQEVQSIGAGPRLNGTSTISSVELIATLKDIKSLETYHDQGYKFMILYR